MSQRQIICGCYYEHSDGKTPGHIISCPLHAAAPALLEALEGIEDRLHKLVNGGGAEGKPTMGELKRGLRAARDEARIALEAAK